MAAFDACIMHARQSQSVRSTNIYALAVGVTIYTSASAGST